jgi:hypothetical protein
MFLERAADRFAPELKYDPLLYGVLRKQTDRPARVAWRWVCAGHGDQCTLLPLVELLARLGTWIVGECTFESAIEIPPADAPDFARIAADCLAHFAQVAAFIQQHQDSCPPPASTRVDTIASLCKLDPIRCP